MWEIIYGMTYDKKLKQAIEKAFGMMPSNIVMTGDKDPNATATQVAAEQEKLRIAIEKKRQAEAQTPQQSQIDAIRAMAQQQSDSMRRQQYVEGMRNIGQVGGQYGASSYPFNMIPPITWDPEPKPKRNAKPAVPESTPEEAQEKLTGIGKRKIILGGDK